MATKEKTYSDAEIAEKLKSLAGWYYEDGWIRRQYKTDGWLTTLMLVNTIGFLAEAAYHHPDLTVTWAKVWVKLQNHAAGGITDKDFELARKIEDTVLWKPTGGALEGTPEQVGAGRRSEVVPPVRVLFVTGKLAEPALRRVLAEMEPAFVAEVAVLKITVAALMTTPWIAKFLEVPPGADLVLLPGLGEGDSELLAAQFGVTVEKGPKDLREIPEYFGQAATARDYGAYDIEILAEINNAPKRQRDDLPPGSQHYRASGADVIDIGCTPGVPFPGLADLVRELRADGGRVSVDSFDRGEIRTRSRPAPSWC